MFQNELSERLAEVGATRMPLSAGVMTLKGFGLGRAYDDTSCSGSLRAKPSPSPNLSNHPRRAAPPDPPPTQFQPSKRAPGPLGRGA
jgi:hypothetical protein